MPPPLSPFSIFHFLFSNFPHFFACYPPRFRVRRHHILHRRKLRLRSPLQNSFNHFRNPQKRQSPLQKRRHRHLIRRIQRARPSPALFHRLPRQPQTRKPPRRSLLKIQPPQFPPIQVHLRSRNPRRIRQRILNRHPHIRRPQLRQHRPVHILHHRMNRRLRMNHHLNLLRLHPKQPPRLNHLESLVHHRRRINRDPVPHPPIRMSQRLLRRHIRQILQRRLPKRPARRRQNNPQHFPMRPAAQALVYRVVLAVHRQQFLPRLLHRRHHQLAGRHQHFLIRKRNHLPQLDRLVSSFQSHHAHGRGHHNLRRPIRPNRQHPLAPMMNRRQRSNPLLAQPRGKLVRKRRRSHRHHLRPVPLNLSNKFFDVRPRSQPHHAKLPRQRFHHGQTLPPNRSRATQYRNSLHPV